MTAFACFAALLVLISAYCTDRNGAVDEPGFLNPPYMLAHYGHLTFPTYAYNGFYDLPVITHPPIAVFEILSPEDTLSRMMTKLGDYEQMGILTILVLDLNGRNFRYSGGDRETPPPRAFDDAGCPRG